uniref:Platelet glycoprotein 4 n=2 Tax=Lygus hesperus TaxID=30085 RepID=A0A0A9WQC9_LYGHE
MMEHIKRYIGYNVGHETEEIRRKFQENSEAIIYRFQGKHCKPFFGSFAFYLVLVTFMSSLVCAVVMHFTNLFDNGILSIVALKDGGIVFGIWRAPTFPFYINMHLFNYTNAEKFLAGEEKAKLQEIGPYVFEERSIMFDLKFDGKEYLTYTENRTHTFLPERSIGSLNDTLIVPNVVYISAISVLRNERMIKQMSTSAIIRGLRTKLFQKVSVEELILGYDDSFSVLARKVNDRRANPEPFGLLVPRNGIGHDRITIGTGVTNLSNFGIISKINGAEELPWYGPTCNDFHGSDGMLFPADGVMSDRVYTYAGPLCRKIPMLFHSEAEANGLPARRFKLPINIFGNATDNPENACFCQKDCPPSGGFLASPCFQGSPVVISFPHFLHGSKELLEPFEGLNPDPDLHEFFFDIHEVGIPLGGHTRLQLNIMVHHARYMGHLKPLKQGLVLPLAWLDIEIGEINGTARMLLWNVSYTVKYLRIFLRWGSVALATLMAFILVKNC